MDIRELAAAANEFRAKLENLKRANRSQAFAWYPYDPFSVFPVLNRFLTGERRKLLSLAETGLVLDIGCGDGGLSFFFESCGCRVLAVDNASPNYNQTRGFKTLAAALNSSVEFFDRDIDAGLALPGRTFGLAVCLGVLYHLKNPFSLLETLARHARYCLLSTRIAQVTVHGTRIADEPVAYLLGRSEANDDASNYWIFSEAGLRRILDRTGWDLCDYETTGFDRGSNPSADDRDQRAFCLLASKLPDPWLGCDLEGGWHAMEDGTWRWTQRSFTVRLKAPASAQPVLRLRFTLPDVVLRATGPLRLQAIVGLERLPPFEYTSAGEHTYEQPVPPASLRDASVSVRFELDKAMRPAAPDVRELGVQVVFWSSGGGTPTALQPITLDA
jgi:SAM-dependent methyltransferase